MGIAAGVAQGSVQASQVNRAQHRQQTDSAADAQRVRDRIKAHLNALDEGDEANLISQVQVDEGQADGRRGGAGDGWQNAEPQAAAAEEVVEGGTAEAMSVEATADEDDKKERLYRHLDVTG